MPKKMRSKANRRQPSADSSEKNVPVSKQTAGGVTGAVLGAVVAGPAGAIAGGVTGAIVGDESAKGKKPIKRAFDAIRAEISGAGGDRVKQVLKSVTSRITSLGKSKKAKKAATKRKPTSTSAPASTKSKSKPAAKKAKSAKKSKAAPSRKKKRKENAWRLRYRGSELFIGSSVPPVDSAKSASSWPKLLSSLGCAPPRIMLANIRSDSTDLN